MPSVLPVSASLKLKDIFKLQHKLLSTASTLLLTEVWRHYRLISALADCISIHWRARLNKYRSQNIIVGWALGFPSCPSLTWTGQVHCSTAPWSCWPRLAVGCCSKAKQSQPISFHHRAAEQKRIFCCCCFSFDWSISFGSSWHQKIKLSKAECGPHFRRILNIFFVIRFVVLAH